MTPRCANHCGRFVWNYRTGLCALCDPETTRRREGQKRGADPDAPRRSSAMYRLRKRGAV